VTLVVGRSRASSTSVMRPVPPFRLDLTVWALRRRSRNLIDRWDGTTYRRVLTLGFTPTELTVRQEGSVDAPQLIVSATPSPRAEVDRRGLQSTVNRLLGLRIDLADWYQMAAADTRLRTLAERFRGTKPPRFPTVFEAVVNAFACQQLSLEVGIELLGRLATLCGTRFGSPRDARYAFPTPPEVLHVPPKQYRAIGFSRQKVRALIDLASGIKQGSVALESFAQRDEEFARQQLLEIRGVGRWSAEYVLLRGLGRLSVFPGDDVGAQKRLAQWLGRSHPLDYAGVSRAVKRWQPYAGLVYFHLLLNGLAEAGALD
jgi:DNA-3-methyladenine glycosylase II